MGERRTQSYSGTRWLQYASSLSRDLTGFHGAGRRGAELLSAAVAQAMAVVGRLSVLARVVATTATARIRVATSWLMVWSTRPRASVGTIVPV